MSEAPFPRLPHDHRACMAETLASAEAIAKSRGEKLTGMRRRVLEIVLQSHRPAGAYDVLGALARAGKRPAPPTVYRALEFLLAQGFVHRIDSRNAFVGCFVPANPHASHFLLCRSCGRAAEIADPALEEALAIAARNCGFSSERQIVEITGVCADCGGASSFRPMGA